MNRPRYKQAYRDACELLATVYGDCPNAARGWPCSTICPALQDMGQCWETYFLHPDKDPAVPAETKEAAHE